MTRRAPKWGGGEAGVSMAGEEGLDAPGRGKTSGTEPRDAWPADPIPQPTYDSGDSSPQPDAADRYAPRGAGGAWTDSTRVDTARLDGPRLDTTRSDDAPDDTARVGDPRVDTARLDTAGLETLPPTAPAEPAPATPLGSRYVLDNVIGSGATGRVWRGRRRDDDTPVAVKVLRGDFTSDPDAVVRFLRQRTALVALEHPHLVRVHDLVAEGEVVAIVMDLVDGEDLRRLAGRRALHTDQQLAVVAQVASALAAVHSFGVVHRDVKPENILVTWRNAQPYALLTDFGLARITDAPVLTRTSQLVGTPAYVAPELVESRPAGPPSDVYSLGVTLYELVAGHRPFQATSMAALLRAHLDSEPARPPGVPEPLWELVAGCLAKDPELRPTARDVAAHLHALSSQVSTPPPQPVPPPAPVGGPVPPAGGQLVPEGDQLGHEAGQPGAGDGSGAGVGAGDVAIPQPTTGATRPARSAPPVVAAPRRRRRTSLWIAIAACVLLGSGAGLWFGRPDEQPRAKPAPPAKVSPYHLFYLPVTATSPRPTTIQLQFSDASNMQGFRFYVIFRDRDRIAEAYPGQAPPYPVRSVDRQTRHCWTVAALLETTQPPPPAAPRPACKAADGRASEN